MRWLLLLIFAIKFAIFTMLPVVASGSGSTCQTTIKVMLNNRHGQLQSNHGQAPAGVVGIKISENLNGAIIEEYPPSNLWKLGIVPGDRVIAVEGKSVNYSTFESICRGTPGQLRNLTIVHNGQIRNIAVPLVDARRVVQYNPGFQHSTSMAVQW